MISESVHMQYLKKRQSEQIVHAKYEIRDKTNCLLSKTYVNIIWIANRFPKHYTKKKMNANG